MDAIYIALPFVQFVLSLFLANIVVVSDPSNRVNRLFTLFLLAMAAWGISIFGMRDAFPDAGIAFTREKVALVVIPFAGIIFYHFILRYTQGAPRNRTLISFYVLGAASGILSVTEQAATGMTVKFYGFAPVLGWAFPLVLLAAYPPVIFALVRLTKQVRLTMDQTEKQRLNLLRLGIVALIIGGTSDFLPSLGLAIYPFGIVGNLFFVALTTWGVTRYRLMELRLVLRRGMAYSVVSSFLFALYGVSFGAVFLLTRSLSAPALMMTLGGAVLLVGVIVQPLIVRIQAAVDRAFFREKFDRLAGLAHLNELTKDITDFTAVAGGISEMVRKTVQADWVGIALPEEKRQTYLGIADTRENASGIELDSRGSVVSWLRRHHRPIEVSKFRSSELQQTTPAGELGPLLTAGVDLLVPMTVGGTLSGIIVLGGKLVGTDYTSEDVNFLRAAADQASIAVENARLYANVRRESNERAAVAELARVVGSTLEIDDVLARCAYQVRTLLHADRVVITLLDGEAAQFDLAYVDGLEVGGWGRGAKGTVAESVFRTVVEQHRGAVIELDRQPADCSPMAAAYLNAGLYSMISVPLVSKGKIIGTLNTESCTSEQYGNEELELATRIGAQVTNAVSNSLLYEQALQLAEEREARARLDAENRELQRINEAKIAFLSTVSHELRTPLTSMLAFTDIIHRNKNKNLTEREISHLEVIRRNGRRLSLLIGDLLDVSRIESGALNLDITEFSMNEMIDDLYESFQPLLERKHQTMKLEVQASETLVLGDQDRLAQVVSNLMSNAHKYSGESALIVVSMRADDSRVYLSVKDQGIGISEEDLSQLFTAFFRAENEATRAEQGTGLGLVIVKGIVEMHGGMIKVESELGAGTTFHIEFNRRFAEEQEEKTRKAA